MRERLETLKKLIEEQAGVRIDSKNRKRPVSYARAIFCKVARDMNSPTPLPYADIGEVINRNHATVMHCCKVVFEQAIQEPEFKTLYEVMSLTFDDVKQEEEGLDKAQAIALKYTKLKERNQELRRKLAIFQAENERFARMFDGLNPEEMEEVYYKMDIFTRAIKNRVYTYVRKSKEESVSVG